MSGVLEELVESVGKLHEELAGLKAMVQNGAAAAPTKTTRKATKDKPAQPEQSADDLKKLRDELYEELRKASQQFGIPEVKKLYKPFGNPASFTQLDEKHYPKLLVAVKELLDGGANTSAQDEML